MDAKKLVAYEGRTLEVCFFDGHRIIAKIIAVDPDETGEEVIYEVVEVQDWGALDPSSVDTDVVAAAAAKDIVEIRQLTG